MVIFLVGLVFPVPAQEVTPSGAFTYSYPIEIPPGTNGIAPQLALTYNSMSGNGFLGMGWSLSGLSTITRDASYPVNFDENDHYVWNGEKLIYTGSNTAGDVHTYHTKRESFLRIEAFGNKANPAYWIITQKDGTKFYYGYSVSPYHTAASDGFIEAVGTDGQAIVWGVSKVEDLCGNSYIIEYLEDSVKGTYYPLKVTYTMGNGLSKFRTVIFSYTSRTDHYHVYLPKRMDIELSPQEEILMGRERYWSVNMNLPMIIMSIQTGAGLSLSRSMGLRGRFRLLLI